MCVWSASCASTVRVSCSSTVRCVVTPNEGRFWMTCPDSVCDTPPTDGAEVSRCSWLDIKACCLQAETSLKTRFIAPETWYKLSGTLLFIALQNSSMKITASTCQGCAAYSSEHWYVYWIFLMNHSTCWNTVLCLMIVLWPPQDKFIHLSYLSLIHLACLTTVMSLGYAWLSH